MSQEARDWARNIKGLRHSEKLLLRELAEWHRADTGVAWRSQRDLATSLEVSERQLRRLLNKLESAGLLATTHKGNQYQPSTYTLALGKGEPDISSPVHRPSEPDISDHEGDIAMSGAEASEPDKSEPDISRTGHFAPVNRTFGVSEPDIGCPPTLDPKEASTTEDDDTEKIREPLLLLKLWASRTVGEDRKLFRQTRERYPMADLEIEAQKFADYWANGKKRLKSPVLAWWNWMWKAEQFRLQPSRSPPSPQQQRYSGAPDRPAAYQPGKADPKVYLQGWQR